jgi:adenine-specific DNA glycosylase
VTCIFLNKTAAIRVGPFLKACLEHYPSPDSLRSADLEAIEETYFNRLGLAYRARWLVSLANQLLYDPLFPYALRSKTYYNAGPPSEVAYLTGVGEYASDA